MGLRDDEDVPYPNFQIPRSESGILSQGRRRRRRKKNVDLADLSTYPQKKRLEQFCPASTVSAECVLRLRLPVTDVDNPRPSCRSRLSAVFVLDSLVGPWAWTLWFFLSCTYTRGPGEPCFTNVRFTFRDIDLRCRCGEDDKFLFASFCGGSE